MSPGHLTGGFFILVFARNLLKSPLELLQISAIIYVVCDIVAIFDEIGKGDVD